MTFDRHALDINAQSESERIGALLGRTVRTTLRRSGAVVGTSGGIDSSVVLALCTKSLGPERVRALIMPERDSDPESELLARDLAARYGVEAVVENISACLAGFGCYRRKDEAIRRIFPEYDAARGYRSKITLPPNLLDEDTLNVFSLTILRPDGEALTKALPPAEYRQIVAASNLKQRTRMAMLYYHAEQWNYAVVGTANKNEYDQGFFVKYGDGGVDVQPIVHLYKTQVYQLARFLGVPDAILRRTPTTDTYSAPTTQQEFFFRLPFEIMDLLWFGMDHEIPIEQVGAVMELSALQVRRAYSDFARKRRTTEYLRMPPLSLAAGPPAVTAAVALASSPKRPY